MALFSRGSLFFLVLLSFFCLPSEVLSQTAPKVYLPGDFVHVIVEAPIDTAQINAIMPDSSIIALVQERRTNVWRGIWQVPINFKKGTYFTKLRAVDVAGNVFEGQTDSFAIGELSLITLVGKSTLEAARPQPAPIQEKISLEAAAAGTTDKNLLKAIQTLIAQPIKAPAPEISPPEKQRLVRVNIDAGRQSLSENKLSEAAAYFRVALYLDPKNKTVGSYLTQVQQKIDAEKSTQRIINIIIFSSLVVGCLFLLLIFFVAFRGIFSKSPVSAPSGVPAPKTPSEKEKEQNWCRRRVWKENPFKADLAQKIFAGNVPLEMEGLKIFIKARIESVGGTNLTPFTSSAIEEIFRLSKGKPKEALKICEWAILQCVNRDKDEITAELIKEYEKSIPVKLLIADDEEIVRTSLELILKKAGGFEIDFASDGQEALNKIKGNVYGVILLDIAMPKLDGYEVLKQARELYPSLPILFVTGRGDAQRTIESISKYNLTGYIEKPFTPEKVFDAVARALKGK